MDIFRFLNPDNPTLFDQGYLINGLTNKLWIERYRDISSFELVSKIGAKVHEKLPIGSLISHIETSEVMIVENHEITENIGQETEVRISGRGFESFLENRMVGAAKPWPTAASGPQEYTLGPDFPWNQAISMMRDHIHTDYIIDLADAVPNLELLSTVPGTGEEVLRYIKRGDLYTRLIELLVVADLGVKVMRPGPRSPLGIEDPRFVLVVHQGEDLTEHVAFSHITGEIDNADYLWSNKSNKNAAFVSGKWIETVVKDSSEGYNRRWMFVDASDIDGAYETEPFGSTRSAILVAMATRGRAALAAQREVALVKTEITKNSTLYRYREHYDVGDIVTVEGAYSETAVMQVTEYVEMEDENGQSGYPTLSAI